MLFGFAVLVSVYQLGSLGKGITTSFANAKENVVATVAPTTGPTAVPTGMSTTEFSEEGFAPDRIVIDSVGVNLLVFAQKANGDTWNVLPHAANYAEDTSRINRTSGNVGIYALDTIDGFAKLEQLENDTEIVVYGEDKKATYKITYSGLITSDMKIFEQTEDPTLTLIAVDGSFENKTYIVKAMLVKIENN